MKHNFAADDISVCSYQSLFWLFMGGSIVGFILEGLWSVLKTGQWQHHAAVVWGPFCIIYGIGAAAVYWVSLRLIGKKLPAQFFGFLVVGCAVEYAASLFQELCFGSVSWDYSGRIMNINGRICLRMAIIWGILGVLCLRFLFPLFEQLLRRFSGKQSAVACRILTIFMAVNLLITSAAVIRWRDRLDNIPAQNRIEQMLDRKYDNERMRTLFPNMVFLGAENNRP